MYGLYDLLMGRALLWQIAKVLLKVRCWPYLRVLGDCSLII